MSLSTRERRRQGGLDRKLAAYAMAGGALVAATAGDAAAGIVIEPINQSIGTNLSQTSLTVTAGSNDVVTFGASSASLDVTSYPGSAYVVTGSGTVEPLVAGDVVGPSSNYNLVSATKTMATYGTTATGNFANLSKRLPGSLLPGPHQLVPDRLRLHRCERHRRDQRDLAVGHGDVRQLRLRQQRQPDHDRVRTRAGLAVNAGDGRRRRRGVPGLAEEAGECLSDRVCRERRIS